ncbi:hypothetical protein RFI_11643 [Reticulomyxa filosa]|uniref:Uncharacterized protein n=1 Tax=Reticulomyxa filosa TaxID=46433 RepID=X6NGQ1_RETFI|nr:hypothetical protein RFI_11643 [Reticulomyxa filosa]|eukprot:ETO25495.1 hypothetical protein RFI_11643 [Reticulomyxa filosa]
MLDDVDDKVNDALDAELCSVIDYKDDIGNPKPTLALAKSKAAWGGVGWDDRSGCVGGCDKDNGSGSGSGSGRGSDSGRDDEDNEVKDDAREEEEEEEEEEEDDEEEDDDNDDDDNDDEEEEEEGGGRGTVGRC